MLQRAAQSRELCLQFVNGDCRHGDSCMRWHGPATRSEAAPRRSSVVCRSFRDTGRCRHGEGCWNVHARDVRDVQPSPRAPNDLRAVLDARAMGSASEPPLEVGTKRPRPEQGDGGRAAPSPAGKANRRCSFFDQGWCRKGDRCRFLHDAPLTAAEGSSSQRQPLRGGVWASASRTVLYCSNLPPSMTSEGLMLVFDVHGELDEERTRVAADPEGRRTGHVHFKSAEGAAAALCLDGVEFGGLVASERRAIRVEYARVPEEVRMVQRLLAALEECGEMQCGQAGHVLFGACSSKVPTHEGAKQIVEAAGGVTSWLRARGEFRVEDWERAGAWVRASSAIVGGVRPELSLEA